MTPTDKASEGSTSRRPPADPSDGASPYHHGDLRAALIAEALTTIERDGPSSLSLRAVAKSVGVSNAAPVHHFGDKLGLFTAIAVEGHHLLREQLEEAWNEHHTLLEVGVAYVGFAVTHQAHFDVMFRADLHHGDEPDLISARESTGRALMTAAGTTADGIDADAARVGAAGWSLMHGVAELWLNGSLAHRFGDDPRAVARELGSFLFRN